jgi:hypothetical protein
MIIKMNTEKKTENVETTPEIIQKTPPQSVTTNEMIGKKDISSIIKNIDSCDDGSLPPEIAGQMAKDYNSPTKALYNFSKFKDMNAQKAAENTISSSGTSFAVFNLDEVQKETNDKVVSYQATIDKLKGEGYKETDDRIAGLEKLKAPYSKKAEQVKNVIENIDRQKLLEIALKTPDVLSVKGLQFFTEGPNQTITLPLLLTRIVEAKTYSSGYLSMFIDQAPNGTLDKDFIKLLKNENYQDVFEENREKFNKEALAEIDAEKNVPEMPPQKPLS